MKKVFLLFCLLSVAVVTGVFAVPAGKTLEFGHTPMGKVVFSGTVHKDAGFKCGDCHNKNLFPKMKQGTVQMKMADIYAGKYCGACHNGTQAFAAKTACNRCHSK